MPFESGTLLCGAILNHRQFKTITKEDADTAPQRHKAHMDLPQIRAAQVARHILEYSNFEKAAFVAVVPNATSKDAPAMLSQGCSLSFVESDGVNRSMCATLWNHFCGQTLQITVLYWFSSSYCRFSRLCMVSGTECR